MEKIYLIHAKAQNGKDTCAERIKHYYELKGKKVLIIAFADYVKFVLDKYYGIPHARTKEYRTHIQQFATDQVRSAVPNFWAEVVAQLLYSIRNDFDIVVIPDWRFENELQAIGFYMIDEFRSGETQLIKVLIERENYYFIDNMTEEQRAHQSENELDNFENFDYTIINRQNEFDEFFKDINTMIKEIENDFTEQGSV